jgi:hypothetical protein
VGGCCIPRSCDSPAAADADTVDDEATISVSAQGLVTETVKVHVLDMPVDSARIFSDAFE